jgi:hypothetical protein
VATVERGAARGAAAAAAAIGEAAQTCGGSVSALVARRRR